MVMGQASTVSHDFLSGFILNIFIDLDNLLNVHASIVEAEVDINCSSCFIELGNSE
jgi:hypothetical protein